MGGRNQNMLFDKCKERRSFFLFIEELASTVCVDDLNHGN